MIATSRHKSRYTDLQFQTLVYIAIYAIFFFFLPFYAMLVLSIVMFLCRELRHFSIWIPSLLMGGCLSLLNSQKAPEGDLAAYADYFYALQSISFDQALTFSFLNIRVTEIIFRLYVWCLSQIAQSPAWFVGVSTMIVYSIAIVFPIKYIELTYPKKEKVLFGLVGAFWVCFFCMTFSLTAHVTRQYLGLSVFLLGILFLLRGSKYFSILLMLLSGAVHNATLVLLPIFMISVYFKERVRNISFVVGALVFSLLASVFVSFVIKNIPFLGDRGEAESVGIVVLMLDIGIFMLFGYLYRKNFDNVYVLSFYSFSIFYICFLIIIYGEPLIFLRFYFVFDFIRSLMGFFIFLRIEERSFLVISPLLVFVFLAVFCARLYMSPWNYGAAQSNIMIVSVEKMAGRINEIY